MNATENVVQSRHAILFWHVVGREAGYNAARVFGLPQGNTFVRSCPFRRGGVQSARMSAARFKFLCSLCISGGLGLAMRSASKAPRSKCTPTGSAWRSKGQARDGFFPRRRSVPSRRDCRRSRRAEIHGGAIEKTAAGGAHSDSAAVKSAARHHNVKVTAPNSRLVRECRRLVIGYYFQHQRRVRSLSSFVPNLHNAGARLAASAASPEWPELLWSTPIGIKR
jgi:hypothetical protein